MEGDRGVGTAAKGLTTGTGHFKQMLYILSRIPYTTPTAFIRVGRTVGACCQGQGTSLIGKIPKRILLPANRNNPSTVPNLLLHNTLVCLSLGASQFVGYALFQGHPVHVPQGKSERPIEQGCKRKEALGLRKRKIIVYTVHPLRTRFSMVHETQSEL